MSQAMKRHRVEQHNQRYERMKQEELARQICREQGLEPQINPLAQSRRRGNPTRAADLLLATTLMMMAGSGGGHR